MSRNNGNNVHDSSDTELNNELKGVEDVLKSGSCYRWWGVYQSHVSKMSVRYSVQCAICIFNVSVITVDWPKFDQSSNKRQRFFFWPSKLDQRGWDVTLVCAALQCYKGELHRQTQTFCVGGLEIPQEGDKQVMFSTSSLTDWDFNIVWMSVKCLKHLCRFVWH